MAQIGGFAVAKPATRLEPRIRRLELAQQRAAAFGLTETISFKPMQMLLGVSRPILTGWCDDIDGFEAAGCFVRGGNGIEWAFLPRYTIHYLIGYFRDRASDEAAKSRAITDAIGVQMPTSGEVPSLAETKDLVGLTLSVIAAQERQGQFMVWNDVENFLAGYNDTVVAGILGTKTKVDPNGNLPVKVRSAIDEHLRSVAVTVHASAEKFIEEHGAGPEQKRAGRAG